MLQDFGDRFIRAKNRQTVVLIAAMVIMTVLFSTIIGATIAAARYFH